MGQIWCKLVMANRVVIDRFLFTRGRHHGTSLPNTLNQLIMRLCSVADKKFVRYCYFLPAFSDNLSAVQPAKREFGPALAGAGRLFRPL